MNPRIDRSVVVTGFWNRMIFTPEWVGSVLYGKPELEIQIPIMPVSPIIFSDSEVELHVTYGRLVFKPKELRDECLNVAQELAIRAMRVLDDTPVSAMGFNF